MQSVYYPLRRLAAVLASGFCHQFYKFVQLIGTCVEFAFDIFISRVCRSKSLEISVFEAIIQQEELIHQTLVVQVEDVRLFSGPVHLRVRALWRHTRLYRKCSVCCLYRISERSEKCRVLIWKFYGRCLIFHFRNISHHCIVLLLKSLVPVGSLACGGLLCGRLAGSRLLCSRLAAGCLVLDRLCSLYDLFADFVSEAFEAVFK